MSNYYIIYTLSKIFLPVTKLFTKLQIRESGKIKNERRKTHSINKHSSIKA